MGFFEGHWESQRQIKEKLKDKPDELMRYEKKLYQATFNDNSREAIMIEYEKKGCYLQGMLSGYSLSGFYEPLGHQSQESYFIQTMLLIIFVALVAV